MLLRLTFLFVLGVTPFMKVGGRKQFHLGRSKGGNLGAPPVSVDQALPPSKWFEQKLDHSAPTDLRTWKQRYFVNDTFFDNKTGPVFLMVGGEGPADPRWMVEGSWIKYAKSFKALCIMVEHRYYGESHPTKDVSVKNLQYLTSNQALADLANFISEMNIKYGLNERKVKWVAFGGSYPGSLVAWLRVKFPHLVFASISSSGPLLAKIDFKEYYEVVANALKEKTHSPNCLKKVRAGHKQIMTLMESNPAILDKEFRTCQPLREASRKDIQNFYNMIAEEFAELAQYNEDNRIGTDNRRSTLTINSVCDMFTSEDIGFPAYMSLAKFSSMMLDISNQTCLDYSYDRMIHELRNMSWTSADGGRQWMYQTCTEFGFYQTSSAEVDVFGNDFSLDFFTQQCQDVFGTKFNENFINAGITWTNNEYGALDITATRVAFVQGSIDPWHVLGMTTTVTNDAPVFYLSGTAHCADMYPASATDSKVLVRARDDILSLLARWLQLP